MESCKCPITQEFFEDPVMADDNHTYERKAIIIWLIKNGTSPITREPMDISSLRTNYTVKKTIEELKAMSESSHSNYPVSNIRHSPTTIECEYCHNRGDQIDYEIHKDNCPYNPANVNYRQPPRTPLRPNQNQGSSNDLVHIPCEICKQPVDLPNWSIYTENCRERERQKMKNRAETMSREPVTEQLPCEHCQQLYTAKQLQSHEIICPENSDNLDSIAEFARARHSPSVFRPIELKDDRNPRTPSNVRDPEYSREQYQRIKIARTRAANRSPGNGRLFIHQHPVQRTASQEILSPPGNSPRSVRADHDDLVRSNEYPSLRNISVHVASQRIRSPSSNSQNIKNNQNPSSIASSIRSLYENDPRQHHYLQHGHEQRYERTGNQLHRPSVKKHKEQFCGPVYESIPAHPDAIYRPQNRLAPTHVQPVVSNAIVPRVMANNAVVAAPLAAAGGGGGGFSPWWIIGPLLALLAALALGALAYFMKKNHDAKKQAEKENEPGKRETNDGKANQNKEKKPEVDKSPVKNVPLSSMKTDTTPKEQKRTAPISLTAKGNSTSGSDSHPVNNVNKDASGRSAVPAQRSPLPTGNSPLASISPNITSSPIKSPHQVIPINVTRMTKPNSDVIEQSDIKDALKTTLTNPPSKSIRSASTHKTGSNYSESLPPSSLASTAQKRDQSTDRNDPNSSKLKFDTNLNKKENQPNDFKKSPSGQNFTNPSRVDPTESLKTGHDKKDSNSPSSRTISNDPNKSGGGYLKQSDSPEQHGVGKSPLLSTFPTGTKRNEKEKSQKPTNQTKEEKVPSKRPPSNLSLQKQQPPEGIILSKKPPSTSDINKDKVNIHSKRDPSSEANETNEKSNKQPSDQYSMMNKTDLDKFGSRPIHSFTKGFDSVSSPDNQLQSPINSPNLQKPKTSTDDKSDQSTTSSTKHNKPPSLLPNVPQCKTNTSSDDDDYDEYYPVPANQQTTSSKRQKTNKLNSNVNINASTYRKKRISFTDKSRIKRQK